MNINLNHLQYFLDASRLQSVTKASELHRVSPSAISQAIKQLGKSLHVDLIIHSKNTFALTEAGLSLQREAPALFDLLRRIRDTIPESELRSSFRFATTYSIALNLLPSTIKGFKKKYPLAKISMQFGSREQVRSWVRSGEIDFGLYVDDGDLTKDLEIETIGQGKFIVAGSTKTNIRKSGIVITSRERPEVQALMVAFKRTTGVEIAFSHEVFSWELVRRFSQIGPHAGYLPDFLTKGLKIIFKDSSLPDYSLVVCSRRRRPLNKIMRLFLAELIRE